MSVDLEKLQEDVKELTLEVHTLQRQQSSRRGPEGPRGLPGVGMKGDKGDPGTVSREQAIQMFREIVKEIFKDEILTNALKDVIAEVVSGTKFRLVRKTAAELAQENKN
jgi:hypothetical protein